MPQPIHWSKSKTIRNAAAVILIQAVAIGCELTGKALDIEKVRFLIDAGLPVLFDTASIFFGWKAITSRVKATETVIPPKPVKLPWKARK
ncbi:MAG: hypothetical protein K2X87_25485 [Gemmataceae bacterium]|nr:hypothetical protein [Gemmataceae bacterium]